MTRPRTGIAPEGVPAIGICAFSALIFSIMGCWPMATIFWIGFLYSLWFFRDPERVIPHAPGLAVSPADGKVIRIGAKTDPFGNENRLCISVFMNLFSVHVNRSPVSGTVSDILYFPGKYFNAVLDKASTDNERCAILLDGLDGEKWCMVQIAGLVARRIVCRAQVGDSLARGERFGLIRFGSRVALYCPEGYTPATKIGENVFGGQTVLARKV